MKPIWEPLKYANNILFIRVGCRCLKATLSSTRTTTRPFRAVSFKVFYGDYYATSSSSLSITNYLLKLSRNISREPFTFSGIQCLARVKLNKGLLLPLDFIDMYKVYLGSRKTKLAAVEQWSSGAGHWQSSSPTLIH